MKKLAFLTVIGLFALASCKQTEDNKALQDSLRMAEMEEKYSDATNLNDSLLLLMSDIYAGLDSINMQEGILSNNGVGDNVDRRAEVKQNLTVIRERLRLNKQMLADLEKKVSKSGSDNKVLQKTIAELRERIEAQDARITELTDQLASANLQIEELTGQVEEGQQQLEEVTKEKEEVEAQAVAAENEANKVFYIMGTGKELKEWGILQKKFLGASKYMQGDQIDFNKFKVADKRTLTSIPTNAKNVEIKSLNEKGSYEIEGPKDGPKTIRITDPEKFWQKTSYLVIETKN